MFVEKVLALAAAAVVAVCLGLGLMILAFSPPQPGGPFAALSGPLDLAVARQIVETEIAQTPEYSRFFARLRETFTADYEKTIKEFAQRLSETKTQQSVDYYLSEAVRRLRQARGGLAAKADPEAMSRVFARQLEVLQAVRELGDETGIAVHLDGARLWNAHVATGVPLKAYGEISDTVSVCLSKGLGAPIGSVLVGEADKIAEARVWRKRTGGGMRQVGVLAAAGHYALDHHLERLADDHARAQRLAFAIAEAVDDVVVPEHVETNIVVLDLGPTGWKAPALAAAAREQDVLLSALGPTFARLVTHLDLDDEGLDRAIGVLVTLLRTAP